VKSLAIIVGEMPFLERFADAIRSGRKTMTARTKRYGNAGDLLRTPCGLIKIVGVGRTTLGNVRDKHWHHEGVDSPEAFEAVWKQLHSRTGFDPERKVWLHRFEFVGDKR
jgi:uncharacterized protein YqfB (UPF0267 family)